MSKAINPLVSVIVPNYNHARYLDERINSILAQTYQNFELIILDDCSKDNSREVINKYKDNSHLSSIVFNETNVGSPFLQWKKGISLAKGELIWIAESDDFAQKTLLEELVTAMNRDPKNVIAYSTSVWVDSDGLPTWTPSITKNTYITGRNFLKKYLLLSCFLYNASSAIFKKSAFANVSDRFVTMTSAGDYMFWAEIANQGNVAIVNKGLNYFRRHKSASSNAKYVTGENLINERIVFDYIYAHASPSKFRIKLGQLYRIDNINRNALFEKGVKQNLVVLWGGCKVMAIYKFIFWLMLHFRLRYNIYL